MVLYSAELTSVSYMYIYFCSTIRQLCRYFIRLNMLDHQNMLERKSSICIVRRHFEKKKFCSSRIPFDA